VTTSQDNGSSPAIPTPSDGGQQWKSTMDWFSRLPPLLNGKGAEDKVAQRVLAALASTANHRTGRNAYPSQAWLADRAHVSVRSVRSALQRLEDGKRIIHDGVGPSGTLRWRLNDQFDCAAGWLPIDAREEHKRELARLRKRRQRTRQGAEAERVTSADPEPSTSESTPEAERVTLTSGAEAECVTQLDVTRSASDELPLTRKDQETQEPLTAVAAAPVGQEVLEAELIEETDNLPAVRAAVVVPAVPNLSASWLLPEPEEAGKRKRVAPVDAPRFDAEAWQMPREQHTPAEWTKTLVGLYVEACRLCGFEPSGRQIGQVGKECRGLIAAGNNPVHILAAVRRAADKRGAWVMRAMADVQPGNWSAGRRGRQVVTSQGIVQLPEGATANMARSVSIRDLLGTS
jgi:hypothetical protein